MSALILTVQILSAAMLAWQAIAHLNRMTCRSPLAQALAWLALGVSAAAVFMAGVQGHLPPDGRAAALLAGMAALAVLDMRRT